MDWSKGNDGRTPGVLTLRELLAVNAPQIPNWWRYTGPLPEWPNFSEPWTHEDTIKQAEWSSACQMVRIAAWPWAYADMVVASRLSYRTSSCCWSAWWRAGLWWRR